MNNQAKVRQVIFALRMTIFIELSYQIFNKLVASSLIVQEDDKNFQIAI